MKYKLRITSFDKKTGEIVFSQSAKFDTIKEATKVINKIDDRLFKEHFEFSYYICEVEDDE